MQDALGLKTAECVKWPTHTPATPEGEPQGVTTGTSRRLDYTNLCQNTSTLIPDGFLQAKYLFLFESCTYKQTEELQSMSDLLVASSSSESKQEVDSSSLLIKDEQLSYSGPPRPRPRDEYPFCLPPTQERNVIRHV